ncbi:hypothetical protein ACETK3_11545 [Arthrobacter sp. E44]|uniref:hypothetical protein n=1 Tax=Arthrobacter sp. E44 TaxID=3341794 RepID=UPI0035A608AD
MAIHRDAGDDGAATSAQVPTKNGMRRSRTEATQHPSGHEDERQAGLEAGNRGTGRTRSIAAFVLGILTAALSFAAVPGLYLHNDVLDTNRYSAIVGPLASDPAVQAAISDRVTVQITEAMDIGGITRDALTELGRSAPRVASVIAGFAPAIAEEMKSLVHTTVSNFVASPQFQDLWVQANRVAHEAIVSSANGNTSGAVSIDKSGAVTISTKEIIVRVKTLLTEEGITVAARIPEIDGQITLFQSPALAGATEAVRAVDRVAPILGWLTVISAIGAVTVAPRGGRLRAINRVGLAAAVAMAGLALTLAVGLDMVLGSIPTSTVSLAAAQSTADVFLAPLRTDMRFVAVAGLMVAAAAFLAGHFQPGESVRREVGGDSGDWAGKPVPGQPRRWQHELAQVRRPLEAAITGAAALVLVLWQDPGPAAAIWTAVLAGLSVLLIEFLSIRAIASGHKGDPNWPMLQKNLPRDDPRGGHPSTEPPAQTRRTADRRVLIPSLLTVQAITH